MLGSVLTYVKSFAKKSAKVAATSVLPLLRDRSIHVPERRLTLEEQLDRLSKRTGDGKLDLRRILETQAAARTALDTAIFELDRVVDGLRAVELLTPEGQACIGLRQLVADAPRLPSVMDDPTANIRRAA